MSYAWPLESHVWQPSVKSLLSWKWVPAPRMKSWPSAIVQPGRHRELPHPPSNKPPQSREVWFDKVVTELLGLLGLINPTCDQYKSKHVHQGQNDVVLNLHRRELPLWNLRIVATLFPPFPSEWSTFSYLPRLITPISMNINIASTHCNHHILLVHEKEVLHTSVTYHSSSTDVYQLSIAHQVNNINTSTQGWHTKWYYHATYHHHTRPYT
jgi:hypothetical protein